MKRGIAALLACVFMVLCISPVVFPADLTREYQYAVLVNDTDGAILYEGGSWSSKTDRLDTSDGTAAVVWGKGAYVEYTFVGTGVGVYMPVNIDQESKVEITIDGEKRQTVNTRGAKEHAKAVYEIHNLYYGTHTIRCTAGQGDGWMLFDQFEIFQDAQTVVDDTYPDISYSNKSMNAVERPDCIDGTAAVFWEKEAAAELEFYGTAIAYYGPTAPDQSSQIGVYIDGVLDQVISTYSEARSFSSMLYYKAGLKEGTHKIRLVKQDENGKWFLLDQFRVYNPGPLFPVRALGKDHQIYLEFNQPVEEASAGIIEHYSISRGRILEAAVDPENPCRIVLTLGTEVLEPQTLLVTVRGLKSALSEVTIAEETEISVSYEGDFMLCEIIPNTDGVTLCFLSGLDRKSAEQVQNYEIEGAQILSASLDPLDGRAVRLLVDGLEYGNSYRVSCRDIWNAALSEQASGEKELVYYGSLAKWFPFEKMSGGITRNEVFPGEPGQVIGTVSCEAGKVGDAFDFDGVNGAVDLGDTRLLSGKEFSVCLWINPAKGDQAGMLLSQDASDTRKAGWNLGYTAWNQEDVDSKRKNTKITASLYDDAGSGGSLNTEAHIPIGAWTHVALVKRSHELDPEKQLLQIFINGMPVCTQNPKSQTVLQHLLAGAQKKSADGSELTNFFRGKIDDLRIYSDGLSDEAVMALYRRDSGKNYKVEAENGRVRVLFDEPPVQTPSLNDFRIYFKRHTDMRIAMPKTENPDAVTPTKITSFSYDPSIYCAEFEFVPIVGAEVEQTIAVDVAYQSVYVKAPAFTIDSLPPGSIPVPEISGLEIDGKAVVRGVLCASYQYEDQRPEHESIYEWYVSEHAEGPYARVPGVYTKSLFVLPEHLGKYLKVRVVPRNTEFKEGAAVESGAMGPVADQTGNPRTDLFYEGKYGISNHLLTNYIGLSNLAIPMNEQWIKAGEDAITLDEYFAAFDVAEYVRGVKAAGAGFVTITMDQHAGYNLAPNPYFDAVIGAEPGEKSLKRDLFGEIAAALKEEGIGVIMYLMGHAPSKASLDAFDGAAPHSPNEYGDYGVTYNFETYPMIDDEGKSIESARKYQQAVRYWSERYGELLDGYWFDGAWQLSKDPENPYNINDLMDAARAGNPNRMVAGAGLQITIYGDMHQGESRGFALTPASGNPENYRWEDPGWMADWEKVPNHPYMQFYNWETLGNPQENAGWGIPGGGIDGRGVRRDTELLKTYTKKVTDAGGVFSMDLRVNRFGELDPVNLLQLKEVCKFVRGTQSNDYPVQGNSCLLIQDRADQYASAVRDVTELVQANGPGMYEFGGWYKGVVTSEKNPVNEMHFTLIWEKAGGGTVYLASPWVRLVSDYWKPLKGCFDLSGYQEGDRLMLKLADTAEGQDYYESKGLVFGRPVYVDQVSMKKEGGPELLPEGGFETGADGWTGDRCGISVVQTEKTVNGLKLYTASYDENGAFIQCRAYPLGGEEALPEKLEKTDGAAMAKYFIWDEKQHPYGCGKIE